MPSITISLEKEFEEKLENFPWINWSAVIKQGLLEKEELQELLAKLNTKEEQEFIKWSVELGRRAKKGTWKRILSELSPKEKIELLK